MEELVDSTGQMYGVGGAGMDVGCLHQRILKPPLGVLSLSQQGIQRELSGLVPRAPSIGVQVHDVCRMGRKKTSLMLRQVGLALQVRRKRLHQMRCDRPLWGEEGRASIDAEEGRQGDGVGLLRAIQFSKIRVMGYSTGYQLLR
eukprot:3679837-Rhodomonas_salina.1